MEKLAQPSKLEDEINLDSESHSPIDVDIYPEGSDNMENNTNKILELNEELIDAAINNNINRVKLSLNSGAELNFQNDFGITALMESSRNGNKEIVKYLISQGADVNIMAENTETALLWAVDEEYLDIIELLVNAGADTNIKGEFSRTPLLVSANLGNVAISKVLLENGANPHLKLDNEDGSTPLSIAEDKGITELIKLLKLY